MGVPRLRRRVVPLLLALAAIAASNGSPPGAKPAPESPPGSVFARQDPFVERRFLPDRNERWIGEAIWRRTGGRPAHADRAAAGWWAEAPGATIDDRLRALEHLLRAADHAGACALGQALTAQLRTDGRDLDAQDLGERLVMAMAERGQAPAGERGE